MVDDCSWAKTGGPNPQRFKFFYNGPESNSRIIAFSSDEQMRHLANSHTWFIDGNFKVSQPEFKQIYVIHAFLEERSVPVVLLF